MQSWTEKRVAKWCAKQLYLRSGLLAELKTIQRPTSTQIKCVHISLFFPFYMAGRRLSILWSTNIVLLFDHNLSQTLCLLIHNAFCCKIYISQSIFFCSFVVCFGNLRENIHGILKRWCFFLEHQRFCEIFILFLLKSDCRNGSRLWRQSGTSNYENEYLISSLFNRSPGWELSSYVNASLINRKWVFELRDERERERERKLSFKLRDEKERKRRKERQNESQSEKTQSTAGP